MLRTRAQVLAKLNDAIDFLAARSAMRRVTDLIVEQRVRCHCMIAAVASPGLRRREQRPAKATPPHVRVNVPRFDVSDRTRSTAVRVWPRAHLDESGAGTPSSVLPVSTCRPSIQVTISVGLKNCSQEKHPARSLHAINSR